ncbi:AAA family ATPase [Qipengyuania sp.]|uniref:AAA family ATPase n=1 Tax=Qipengyuania sp. TaxID=2004515 RepID=UPI003736C74C
MRIVRFTIENFKGIKSTTLDLDVDPPGNVITLIGLNESGKTTVLEALSHFVAADQETTSIVQTVAAQQPPQELIPKARKSNFTGDISIEAEVAFDDDDVRALGSGLIRATM